jgi:hypothetical protein
MNDQSATKFNPTYLVYVALALAVAVLIILRTVELPSPTGISVQGQSTIIQPLWWSKLVLLVPTLGGVLIAVALWMRGGAIPRTISLIVMAVLAIGSAEVIAMQFVHRAELTPDEFRMRLGTWHDPVDYTLKFDDVIAADFVPDDDPPSPITQNYALECEMKPLDSGRTIRLPINDYLKPALRQILDRLKARNAILGDPDVGFEIPKELRRWAG